MAYPTLSLLPLALISLLLLSAEVEAQSAQAPAPSGPINITEILEKGGQFTTFTRLLRQVQADTQINQQVNSSTVGMTVIAPTDDAFNNLPSGTLNNLTDQQQVILVLYHVLPKFYSLTDFLTVSNPVRTQASDHDGKPYGLYFSGGNGNQVNVSTGIVQVPINNALRQEFPLAVYEVDKVLLPAEFYEASAPKSAPAAQPPASTKPVGSNSTKAADASQPPSNVSRPTNMGLGLVGGLLVFCLGFLY